MRYAILAAGLGERLAHEGIAAPKPLVEVAGEAMLMRLVRIFRSLGADEVTVATNTRTASALPPMPGVRLVVCDTPSSMHSFAQIAPLLRGDAFCLTTVDTIFREAEFERYIARFLAGDMDALMATTAYVDDERPLWIGADRAGRITGFHDEQGPCRLVSGGVYCMRESCLPVLERCLSEGRSRMRNFQRALVEQGLSVWSHEFGKIMDVDHASDIPKAEAFLRPKRLLGIARAKRFSPNAVEADRAIFEAVAAELRALGHQVTTQGEDNLSADVSSFDAVFSMARSLTSPLPVPCFNSPEAVSLCNDKPQMAHLMTELSIPQPRWTVGRAPFVDYWTKDATGNVRRRGAVGSATLVQEHVEGREIKFYGVVDTPLFLLANGPAPEAERIREMAERVARHTGTMVYGGDCIIDAHGAIHLIDFNDWPSFRTCTAEAAQAIATLIDSQLCKKE